MNKYNPNIHKRKSIRLKGYDYTQAGLYFVTICVQNRECLFGDITNGILQLNDAGKMISTWYYELEKKFPDIKCGAQIVMPNHFHCIIHNVGADLRVCPNTDTPDPRFRPDNTESHFRPDNTDPCFHSDGIIKPLGNGQTQRSAPTGTSLHGVVQWFKTMTTNEYIRNVKNNNWKRFNGKLWQRNYWGHIIRNEKSHQNISDYIINNPLKWNADKLNSNS